MSHHFHFRRSRRGTTAFEIIVTFSLLTTVISVFGVLAVRHGRLMESHSDYRLALEELSNQLEQLSTLTDEELPGAIEKLAPSDLAKEHLPDAALRGELAPADGGQRITLALTWKETGRPENPLKLSAWRFAKPAAASGDNAEGSTP